VAIKKDTASTNAILLPVVIIRLAVNGPAVFRDVVGGSLRHDRRAFGVPIVLTVSTVL
jgi:hypothetical protein